jgi:hypothetical protein
MLTKEQRFERLKQAKKQSLKFGQKLEDNRHYLGGNQPEPKRVLTVNE